MRAALGFNGLKTLTVLGKRLILNPWLSPGYVSVDDTLQSLKYKRRSVRKTRKNKSI